MSRAEVTCRRRKSADATRQESGPPANNFYAYVSNNPILWIDPLGLVQCWYATAAHYLFCNSHDGNQTFNTYRVQSGNGMCKNNRDCIKTHDQGPNPPGNDGMGPMGHTPNPPRVFLAPLSGTIAFNRGSFEIHPLGKKGSEGCIALDPSEYDRFRTFYANDNSGLLHVP